MSGIDRKATAIDAKNRRRIIAANKRSIAAFGRGAAIGAAAVAVAGVAATKQFAESERQLTRIGLTAEASREEMKKTRKDLLQIGDDVAMPYQSMVEGLDTLTAAGKNLKDSMDFLPSVAATTQASGSQITDTANSAIAISRHFKITANEMQKAFDLMVKGGEAGQFEFKDMAQYLPTLAPAMRALGYEGLEGLKKLIVELQVVREQTGTAGEAATNYQAVLQKLETDRTAKKFAKFGIDLRKEMQAGRDAGEDILDTFKKITRKALKGDLSKIPQLFADAQMAKGVRAMLMGAESAERYNRALKNADGSVMKNLTRVLGDQKAELDRLSNAWTGLINKIGSKVAPPVTGVINSVLTAFERDEHLQAANKQIQKKYGEDDSDFRARYQKVYEKENGKIGLFDVAAYNKMNQGAINAKINWSRDGFNGDPLAPFVAAIARNKRLGRNYIPGTGDRHPTLNVPIPTPRPDGPNGLGVVSRSGDIPIPKSRTGIASREAVEARQLYKTEAGRMSDQYAEYGRGRQPLISASQKIRDVTTSQDINSAYRKQDAAMDRMLGGNREVSIETQAAEKNVGDLDQVIDSMLRGMNGTVKIDTSAAVSQIDKLQRKVDGLKRALASGTSTVRINRGRTMPDAGSVGGL